MCKGAPRSPIDISVREACGLAWPLKCVDPRTLHRGRIRAVADAVSGSSVAEAEPFFAASLSFCRIYPLGSLFPAGLLAASVALSAVTARTRRCHCSVPIGVYSGRCGATVRARGHRRSSFGVLALFP